MKKVALITGGGSGIGQALAKQLADLGLEVVIVGRRLELLKKTQCFSPHNIIPIAADIGTSEGRNLIAEFFEKKILHFLVHNAAVIEPLKTIDLITLEEWRQHQAVNLEGPLFLTQLLLPFLVTGSRILNISSGLAHRAFSGSAAYSISKAGLHMLYHVWNEELASRGILAGSVQPSVVDTEMQSVLRSDKQFVNRDYFNALKTEGKLLSTDKVAKKLSEMLLTMPGDLFIAKDWRIEELFSC